MILEMYALMVEFLEANLILIGLLMVAVEWVKLGVKQLPFYEGWQVTAVAFILGFVFAIPMQGFELMPFIAHGIGLGLTAVGVYKVGEGLARKTKS
jgi:hypothetical protein